MVIVTHDRWFLDEVCERTWEVAGGQVHAYDGGYSAYVLARAERVRVVGRAGPAPPQPAAQGTGLAAPRAAGRTSKPRFRIEAASALIAGEPPPRDEVELNSLAAARLGKTVIDLTGRVGGRGRPDPARRRELAARPG